MKLDRSIYHILIVEDNAGDFTLVYDFLFEQIEAPKIEHAIDFKSAKKLLASSQHPFDVIILDLSLPDKDGVGLITELIELCNSAPIVVLTGYSDFNFGVKSLSLGASDYILKDELTAINLYKSVLYSIERKKINTSLTESKRRYSELFHFSPHPMWLFDLASLKFLEVNNAAVIHYGFSAEEFLTMTLKDLRSSELIPSLIHGINDLKKDKVFKGTFMHKKKNGQLITVEIESLIIDFDGSKAGLSTSIDITERLAYVHAIEEQNEKLKEIAWIQSHVVRAPVARMMGLIDIMKEMEKNDEMYDKFLGYIFASVTELDEHIRNISKIANKHELG